MAVAVSLKCPWLQFNFLLGNFNVKLKSRVNEKVSKVKINEKAAEILEFSMSNRVAKKIVQEITILNSSKAGNDHRRLDDSCQSGKHNGSGRI